MYVEDGPGFALISFHTRKVPIPLSDLSLFADPYLVFQYAFARDSS